MELINEAQIKAHLIQTDADFRGLAEKHKAYDDKLVELETKSHLTSEELLEEVRLKKLKLQAKDQMRDLMARYQATH